MKTKKTETGNERCYDMGEFNGYLMEELGFELVNYGYEKECDNGTFLKVVYDEEFKKEILHVDNARGLHLQIYIDNIGIKDGNFTAFENMLLKLGVNCKQSSTRLNDTILRKYGFVEDEQRRVDIATFNDDFFKFGYSVSVSSYTLSKNGITFMYKCKDACKATLQVVSYDFKNEFEGLVHSEETLCEILDLFGCLDK